MVNNMMIYIKTFNSCITLVITPYIQTSPFMTPVFPCKCQFKYHFFDFKW